MKRHAAILLGVVGMTSIGACGRSDVLYTDDQYGAHGARGGAAGAGGTLVHTTGGTNFTGGTGGGFSGGTGGSPGTGGGIGKGGTGGTGATGGSMMIAGRGGTMSTGGTSGVAGAAGASMGPYACQHTAPTCDTFTNFSLADSTTWGSGAFTGGIAVFGNGITRENRTDVVHVTGTVSDYSNGITIFFATCADLSKYAGVYFTLSGATNDNDEIEVMPWTNADYPWQSQPQFMRGGCTSSNPMNPFVDCVAPNLLATLYPSRQYAYWGDFSGGAPITWSSSSSPSEIVGIQWQFPYSGLAYAVDVTLDDVGFIRSGSAAPDCGPPLNMGGTGGVGGFAGSAGDTGAGTNAGGAGAGGSSGFGAGGFSAGGFSAGGFSAGGFSAGGFSGGDFSAGGFSAGGFSAGGFTDGGAPVGGFSGGGASSAGQSVGGQATGGLAGGN